MKKITVTITAILFFTVAFATDEVEENIKVAFHSKFPGATHKSWTKIRSADLYTVRFVQAQEAMMAYFDSHGNYLALSKSVLEENLPLPVKKSFRKINRSGTITTAEKIVILGETSYLFNFKENGKTKSYQINEDGSIGRMRIKKMIRKFY